MPPDGQDRRLKQMREISSAYTKIGHEPINGSNYRREVSCLKRKPRGRGCGKPAQECYSIISWHMQRSSEPDCSARTLGEKFGEFGWCICFVQWSIHIHFEIWRVKHLKREMFKHEIPRLWMIERFSTFWRTKHLMFGPPGSKFRAAKHQIMDQLAQTVIPRIATTSGTELC